MQRRGYVRFYKPSMYAFVDLLQTVESHDSKDSVSWHTDLDGAGQYQQEHLWGQICRMYCAIGHLCVMIETVAQCA